MDTIVINQRHEPEFKSTEDKSTSVSVARAQRTRLLFTHSGAGLATTLAVTAVIAIYFWNSAPSAYVFTWASAMVLLTAWRLHLTRSFRIADPADSGLQAWHRKFLLGSSTSGLLLGGVWWLVAVNETFENQSLLGLILCAMTMGAAPVLGSSLSVFVLYILGLLMPATLWFFLQDSNAYIVVGSLTLVFQIAMMAIGHGHSRTLAKLFTLTNSNRILSEQQQRLHDFAALGADLF